MKKCFVINLRKFLAKPANDIVPSLPVLLVAPEDLSYYNTTTSNCQQNAREQKTVHKNKASLSNMGFGTEANPLILIWPQRKKKMIT